MKYVAIALAAMAMVAGTAPVASAASQQETNKEINVVGVNSDSSFAFVAVKSPGPSAPPTCFLSLLTMPLTTAGLEQYQTLRDAKIAEKAVTIFFDDADCEVDQVQLQQD
jgi:hypothetical protein